MLLGYDRVRPPLKSTENLEVMVLSTLVSRSQTDQCTNIPKQVGSTYSRNIYVNPVGGMDYL